MPLQIPQLDDRTYQQLVDEAVVRIPVHTPEWNNYNSSDPGITMVQLFAFMTETLLYRTNRIPEANRLKFLSLLGIPLRPASPGVGLVSISNERGPREAVPIDRGCELYAGKVPFRTHTDVNVLPITAAVFYKRRNTSLEPDVTASYGEIYSGLGVDALNFYQSIPLEEPAAGKPLPQIDLTLSPERDTLDGAVWLALFAPKDLPVNVARRAIQQQTLSIGIYPSVEMEGHGLELDVKPLEAQEVEDSGLDFDIALPGETDVANGTASYRRLPVEYSENVLDMPGIVQVRLPEYEALTLWDFDPGQEGIGDFPPLLEDPEMARRLVTWIRIRLSQTTTTTTHQPRLSWVGINAARVIQALRVENERLGVGSGTPNQHFKVANTPVVIESTFVLHVIDEKGQAHLWKRVDDLYIAGREDEVYALDPESGQVWFGDGLRGKRPPFGHVIRVSYEYGGGLQGKIAIGALNKAPTLRGGMKVTNPVATWGASAGQSIEEGERSIPMFLRHRSRLVTEEDFREITLQTPSIDLGRVEVLPNFIPPDDYTNLPEIFPPQPGVVTLMVVPQHPIDQPDPPQPDRLYLDAIRTWLEPSRLITTQIYVRGPVFVPVYVSIGLRLMPGQISAIVRRDVAKAVRVYLSPIVGGPPPKDELFGRGWSLASKLSPQDIAAAVARVPGVRYVEAIRLGVMPTGSTVLQPVQNEAYDLRGLQLPWLTSIDVCEGDTLADLASLIGAPAAGDGTLSVPVPAQLKKC